MIRRVAAAIVDGERVSWSEATRLAETPHERQAIEYLHWITSISAGDAERTRKGRVRLPWWIQPALAVALCQVAVAVTATLTSHLPAAAPFRFAQILLMLSFLSAAGILRLGGRSDVRAQWLAAVYAFTAAAFAHPLMATGAAAWLSPLSAVLACVPLDALIPVALWRFGQVFPHAERFSLLDRVVSAATWVSLAVGLMLIAVNVALAAGTVLDASPAALLDRNHPQWIYWAIVYPLALGALLVPLLRTWYASPAERTRVWLFTAALVGGMVPILVTGLVEDFAPNVARAWTGSAEGRAAVAALVLTALVLVPIATTYAILTRRALSVRFVAERATRYLLARSTLAGLVVLPASLLGWYIFAHREQSISEMLAGPRGRGMALWLLLSVGALLGRARLLALLDRAFRSGPIDHGLALGESIAALRGAAGVTPVLGIIAEQIRRVFGSPVSILRLHRSEGAVPLYGMVGGLHASSAILAIARDAQGPLVFHGESTLLALLPGADRDWVSAYGVEMLLPLQGADGTPLALVAAAAKRDRFPWSPRDISWLTAMGSAAALALDHAFGAQPGDAASESPEWTASECVACGALRRDAHAFCPCGGAWGPALLPPLLNGKFAVDSRIGRGGMGVVYRGQDLTLQRPVALKTLPHLDAGAAAGLRDEARAMGTLIHPHLALIFGVEVWQRTPVLVIEFLSGGTLADRLRQVERMPVSDAIALGRSLADALAALHGAGLLHGDIKPSNIGFTAHGTPKLLDFGLSALTGPGLDGDAEVLAGTPMYLPPEAFEGERPSEAFDLWALSLVVFETIAGAHPFKAPTLDGVKALIRSPRPPDLRARRPDVPPALSEMLAQCLDPRRERRPRSAADWALALEPGESPQGRLRHSGADRRLG